MRRIQIDAEGNLRCWKCGAKSFTRSRSKAGCLLFGPLVASRKTRCLGCGAIQKPGRPTAYPMASPAPPQAPAAPAPAPPLPPPPRQM